MASGMDRIGHIMSGDIHLTTSELTLDRSASQLGCANGDGRSWLLSKILQGPGESAEFVVCFNLVPFHYRVPGARGNNKRAVLHANVFMGLDTGLLIPI